MNRGFIISYYSSLHIPRGFRLHVCLFSVLIHKFVISLSGKNTTRNMIVCIATELHLIPNKGVYSKISWRLICYIFDIYKLPF